MTQSRQFLIKFAVLLVVLYAIVALHPVNDHVIVPYTNVLTWVVAKTLTFIHITAVPQGTVINAARFAMDVHNGCNGIEAVVLLLAAIAAFPASLSDRMKGLLFGLLFVQVVNVVRLVMLFWLGAYHRSVFDLFHVTVWQTIIVLITFAFFYVWSTRVASRTTSAPAR